MQGQSQRGGLRGGRRGFGGPTGGGGNKQDKPTGTGGMTPGIGPGGLTVAGATPDPIGGVAIGGTTAGFAGQPSPGSGAAQSLQDLFAAQQPPAQGIATLPTNEDLMNFVDQLQPNLDQTTTFQNFIDVFGFPPMSPLNEDDTSSFESGEDVLSNIENVLNAIKEPKIDVGIGTLSTDLEEAAKSLFNNNPSFGLKFTVPLN